MNIKVKAGLDVIAAIIGFMFIGFTVRQVLEFLSATYGTQNTINGILTVCVIAGLSFTALMLYKIRVSELEYRAKLKEMVNK
jgi:hypothetical protein